jgi:hypothetical protein
LKENIFNNVTAGASKAREITRDKKYDTTNTPKNIINWNKKFNMLIPIVIQVKILMRINFHIGISYT